MAVERRPAADGRPPLEIHRSARRRRTAAADARDGVLVVRLPAGLPADEEERLVASLVAKVTRRERTRALGGDDALARRAAQLADDYLDGVRPRAVRWSARMARRLGSCTHATGEIRISQQVAAFPDWVRDYVIVHELAHLVVADHSPDFHALVARYPWAERARGWVEGYTAGQLAAHTPGDAPVAGAREPDPPDDVGGRGAAGAAVPGADPRRVAARGPDRDDRAGSRG